MYAKYPGVYALGHPALPAEGELVAALFFAGPGAALSHATAVWWWRLVEHRPAAIDLSVPRRRRSAHGVRLHTPRQITRTWHRRLPVTTVARTLLDFAVEAPGDRLRRALAEAEYRELLDLQAVQAVLRRGHPGSASLRRALADHCPALAHVRSALEERFLALCESAEIARPEINATVGGLMVDALWRAERVIVELDGRAAHRTAAQLERDHQRDLALRAAGYVVLRYTWQQITRHPEQVIADLRAALIARV